MSQETEQEKAERRQKIMAEKAEREEKEQLKRQHDALVNRELDTLSHLIGLYDEEGNIRESVPGPVVHSLMEQWVRTGLGFDKRINHVAQTAIRAAGANNRTWNTLNVMIATLVPALIKAGLFEDEEAFKAACNEKTQELAAIAEKEMRERKEKGLDAVDPLTKHIGDTIKANADKVSANLYGPDGKNLK